MTVKLVESKEELQQILYLQSQNHLENLSTEQQQKNGFVTVKHSLDLLKQG